MVDDALIAPGATNTERLLGYGAGVCGAIFAGTTGALQGISGRDDPADCGRLRPFRGSS